MSKRILFIGHEASRTGAPLSLLHLMQWMKKDQSAMMTLWVIRGGALLAAYQCVAKTVVLTIWPDKLFAKRAKGIVGFLQRCLGAINGKVLRAQYCLRIDLLKKNPPDVIYCNSIETARLLHRLAELKRPIVMHIHELASGLATLPDATLLERIRTIPISIIVPSPAVKQYLVHTFGFAEEKVQVIAEIVTDGDSVFSKEEVCTELQIPIESKIVGMAGTIDLRKGIDYFLSIARTLTEQTSNVHCVWIGKPLYPQFVKEWQTLYGIPDSIAKRIHFLGEKTNAGAYIATLDVFMLTSREDPMPLVHIEAAKNGVPIVCFAGTGGAPEWIETEGGGQVVPYADTEVFAAAVKNLLEDDEKRAEMSKKVQDYAHEHFSAEKLSKETWDLIDALT